LTGFWLVLGLSFILNMIVAFGLVFEVVLEGWMVALGAVWFMVWANFPLLWRLVGEPFRSSGILGFWLSRFSSFV